MMKQTAARMSPGEIEQMLRMTDQKFDPAMAQGAA